MRFETLQIIEHAQLLTIPADPTGRVPPEEHDGDNASREMPQSWGRDGWGCCLGRPDDRSMFESSLAAGSLGNRKLHMMTAARSLQVFQSLPESCEVSIGSLASSASLAVGGGLLASDSRASRITSIDGRSSASWLQHS
jgi:hypothetical protein